jgi:hypothetical protein
MEKELREAVTELCHADEPAAEILLHFVNFLNEDTRMQSPTSMMHHLTTALVEFEGAMEPEPEPGDPPPLVHATSAG